MTNHSASVLAQSEWATDGSLNGELQGRDCGVGISLILNDLSDPDRGPDLHRHNYAETIVVISGRAMATLDGTTREIADGDIVFIPAGVTHSFKSLPGAPFRAVDIHESSHFATEWL